MSLVTLAQGTDNFAFNLTVAPAHNDEAQLAACEPAPPFAAAR